MWEESKHPRDEDGKFTDKKYTRQEIKTQQAKIDEMYATLKFDFVPDSEKEKVRAEIPKEKELLKKMKENKYAPEDEPKQEKPQTPKYDDDVDEELDFYKAFSYNPSEIKFIKGENSFYGNIYSTNNANEFIEKAQDLKPYQKGKADQNNFFINTIAKFNEIKGIPKDIDREEPDHTSFTRDGEISSEYWYTKDGVYRRSNHWGCGVASCDWLLDTQETTDMEKGDRKWGFCKWENFIHKAKAVSDRIGIGDNPTLTLSNFTNIDSIKKMRDGTKYIILKRINEEIDDNNKNDYFFGQFKSIQEY